MPLSFELKEGRLSIDGLPCLDEMPAGWLAEAAPKDAGLLLSIRDTQPGCYREWKLGRPCELGRFTGQARFVPFWLKPINGDACPQVPVETIWLLWECGRDGYRLLVPLLDGASRFCLKGGATGLEVVGETGDSQTNTPGGRALFIAAGSDPYELLEKSARAVQELYGLPHRLERQVPDFADQFGWCTWDAFYKEVTPEKIRQGLQDFTEGGVSPGLLIIDDGWQSVRTAETGEERLVSLEPNERFSGSLAPAVAMAKEQFGVRSVLVWHALLGYWGGLDDKELAAYSPRTVPRSFGPGILSLDATWNVRPWGSVVGVPAAGRVEAFFNDYHASLAAQGVDGVKVDNQAMLEAVSEGQGGRVLLSSVFRRGLEGSVTRHFHGRIINCMACTQEMLYQSRETVVLRSSDDFYPLRPETHGQHLHANAQSGLWLGEFLLPDWDMFQSAHPQGAMHAAARAISGGPVYVSDKIGMHDFGLLNKLVLSDGSILRCDGPARPTLDSLFDDPTRTAVALRLQNRNAACGVLGLFNIHDAGGPSVEASARPSDVKGLARVRYACFAHNADRLWTCLPGENQYFHLAPLQWEIVSYSPIENDCAVLGLADKFNSCAAVRGLNWVKPGTLQVRLRDVGHLLVWARRPPVLVRADEALLTHRYHLPSGRLDIEVPAGKGLLVEIVWA
jgi:raffinose synthase